MRTILYNITGEENLRELVRDALVSNVGVRISRDKNSIVPNDKPNSPANNTQVTITLETDAATISLEQEYNRVSLANAFPHETIVNLTIEDYSSPYVDEALKRETSRRLGIPESDFRVYNIELGDNGLGTFYISSYEHADTIIRDVQMSVATRFKRFIINDVDETLGIGIPPNKIIDNVQTFYKYPTKRTPMEVLRKFVSSKHAGKEIDFGASTLSSISIGKPISPLSIPGLDYYNYTAVRVQFSNIRDWLYSGTYSIRTLRLDTELPGIKTGVYELNRLFEPILRLGVMYSAEMDAKAAMAQYKKLSTDVFKLIPYKFFYNNYADYFGFMMYMDPEYAQRQLAKEEYLVVEEVIKKQLYEQYGIQEGFYTIRSRLGEYTEKKNEIDVSVIFIELESDINLITVKSYSPAYRKDPNDINSPFVTAVPIFLMYSKESKCDFGLLRNYADSSNHMGFIQGGLDGWSIGDAEWWEVDAGLVVDKDGNSITRTDQISWEESFQKGTATRCQVSSDGSIIYNNIYINAASIESTGNNWIVTSSGFRYDNVTLSYDTFGGVYIEKYIFEADDVAGSYSDRYGKTYKLKNGMSCTSSSAASSATGSSSNSFSSVTTGTKESKASEIKPVDWNKAAGLYAGLDLALIKNTEINGFIL